MGEADDAVRRHTKRSAAISLVLVAGAGATGVALDRTVEHGESGGQNVHALIYRSLDACLADQVRSAKACSDAEAAARAAYAATAPRYETLEDCERHHGRVSGCIQGATVTPAAQGRFLPVMAAFMMGWTDAQNMPVQPLYPPAPEEKRYHSGGSAGGGGGSRGYTTGSGERVASGSGGSSVKVSETVARTTTTPHSVARGGFGGTGQAVASAGGHGSGGHGSGG